MPDLQHARANRPLDGVTVIDFGQIYQGPYATFLMAKAGADVIKVEPLVGEPMRYRAKGLLAKLCAQAIFLTIWAVVIVITLIAVKHGFPDFDIYGVLDWLYETFPSLKR